MQTGSCEVFFAWHIVITTNFGGVGLDLRHLNQVKYFPSMFLTIFNLSLQVLNMFLIFGLSKSDLVLFVSLSFFIATLFFTIKWNQNPFKNEQICTRVRICLVSKYPGEYVSCEKVSGDELSGYH